MMELTALNDQSLFDIALQASGSCEAAFDLALENDLSITDDLAAGQKLQFSQTPINKPVAEYYRVNAIKPATGGVVTGEPEDEDRWILSSGFWRDMGIWLDNKFWID